MSDLQFVAISDDGKMIILQTPNGEWIEVPFDASLVAPSRPPVEAPAKPDEVIDLSPREIQSRVRAGGTVEELARMSGSTHERIMSFAAPILMERQHVALRAGRTIIRRSSGAGPLSDVIEARLEPHGVLSADIEWDSFRREDGRWTVIIRYPSKEGEREAHWLFDVRNSALVPADDEARWLVGEVPAGRATVSASAETVAMTVPHLVALPTPKEPHLPEIRESQVIKREVPLQSVPTQTPAPTPTPAAPPVSVTQVVRLDGEDNDGQDIQDSLFENQSAESVVEQQTSDEEPTSVEEEPMADYRRHTQIFERPTIAPEMRDSLAPSATAAPIEFVNSWAETREDDVSPRADDDTASIPPIREVAFEEPKTGLRERETTVEVKKSRAPSWDEILFGGGNSEDEPF